MALGVPFAMDIYVPALPQIAHIFRVSAGNMQLTLTVFMLTVGVVQLFFGPLSDHCGRKGLGLLMISIFSAGTLLCSFAHSIYELVTYRIIQALGSGGMLILSRAIVRDIFDGEQSAKAYSFLGGIMAFSPMLAPFIGSYLDVSLGWPSTFLFLLILALAAFITLGLGLPETLMKSRRHQMKLTFLLEYGQIVKHPVFLMYTISTTMGLSYLYLFCSISPYIIIRLLHIPEIDYGFYFCFMGISFFMGSMLSGYIVDKIGIYRTVLLGLFVTLIGGIIMAAWYFIVGLTIDNFVWPMLLIGTGGTLCMGAGNGGAMAPFPRRAGAAAALLTSCQFSFSAILGAFLIYGSVSSTLPLALPAIVFSVSGLIVFIICRPYLDFRLQSEHSVESKNQDGP